MMDGGQRGNLMGSNNTQNKILVMVCINLANLVCHSVYSVLAAFFPQEGKAKGMSDDTVGVIFAAFAAVSIVCSPFVGRLMSMHGKVWIYILGLLLVSVSTISFSVASLLPAGAPFAAWCLAMRSWMRVEARVLCAPLFSTPCTPPMVVPGPFRLLPAQVASLYCDSSFA